MEKMIDLKHPSILATRTFVLSLRACAYFGAGLTREEIAAKLGVPILTVNDWIAMGEIPKRGRPTYPQEIIKKARLFYESGLSIRAVAKLLCLVHGTVQYWLRTGGVKLRSKSQALTGRVLSPEHHAKVKKVNVGRKLSEEHKTKISSALKGRKPSDKVIQEMSLSRRRSLNPNYKAGPKSKNKLYFCKLCGSPFFALSYKRNACCSRSCSAKLVGQRLSKYYQQNPEKRLELAQKISATKKKRILEDPEYLVRLRMTASKFPKCTPERIKKRLKTINGRYTASEISEWANKGGRGKVPWNKGLTKESDPRVAKQAQLLIGHKPNRGSGCSKGEIGRASCRERV